MKDFMGKILKKITSRKFILVILSIVGASAIVFKESEDTSLKIAGIIAATVVSLAYLFVEGSLDLKSIIMMSLEAYKEIKKLEKEETLTSGYVTTTITNSDLVDGITYTNSETNENSDT